jgi:triosephosphate isomerase
MLKDVGAKYVIIGHSERTHPVGKTLSLKISRKKNS